MTGFDFKDILKSKNLGYIAGNFSSDEDKEKLEYTVEEWNFIAGKILNPGKKASEGSIIAGLSDLIEFDELLADVSEDAFIEASDKSRTIMEDEKLYINSSGEEKHIELTVMINDSYQYLIILDDISEEKSNEERIAELEEERDRFSASYPGIIYKCYNSFDWEMKYVSQGCEDLTGYKPEELVDNRVLAYGDLIKPEYKEEVWNKIQKSLADKQPFEIEYKIETRDEGEKWVWEKGRGIYNEGEAEKIYGFITDITEMKRTEKKLQLMQKSLEKASFAIFWTGPRGEIKYVNDRACEMLDYSRSELLQLKFSDIDKDADPEGRSGYWQQLIKNKELQRERKFISKNERVFPAEVLSHHLFLAGDEYEFVFARDISERKAIEKELKMREEQYRKIFRTAPVGILIQDDAGNILEVNDRLCEITGYSHEELESSSIFETLVPEEIEEKAKANIDRILAGEDLTLTGLSRSSTGEEYYVHLKETKIKLPEGREGVLSMHLDITDLKEKEKELEYLSYHDSLTGLYNRLYLKEKLQEMNMERQLPAGIIMCDVNGMKIINETYGFNKGDRLLIRVAEILQKNIRDDDILVRWTGDEFIIVLPGSDIEMAAEIKDRIEEDCKDAVFEEIPINLGMGVAVRNTLEEDFEDVLVKAEERMRRDKLTKSHSTENKLVQNVLNTLGAKSAETREHAERMADLVQKLGEKMGLPTEELNKLSLLATLHDIGKATISEDILIKSDDLTQEEWEIIKEHPERGYKIAVATEEFAPVARAILHHHEWWNGTGYPEGLKGQEIPLISRMIAIVDAYDVMISGRPYKAAMSCEEALEEIEECAGEQFDPELVEKFVEMLRGEISSEDL